MKRQTIRSMGTITDGRWIALKRVPVGVYILEETRAPSGYAKRMPTGLDAVEEPVKQSYAY